MPPPSHPAARPLRRHTSLEERLAEHSERAKRDPDGCLRELRKVWMNRNQILLSRQGRLQLYLPQVRAYSAPKSQIDPFIRVCGEHAH